MRKIAFSEKEIDEIINLYITGEFNLSEIGEKYNVSKTTIKRILIRNEIKLFSPGQRYKGGPELAKKRFQDKRNKIVAHQYKIRKEKEKLEKDNLSFEINKVSLKNTKIEIIDRATCKKIVDEYEWLGYLPRYTNLHFGIYFEIDGNYYLGGVVAYQPEYGENLGVWDKFNYTGKIIQLSRGVCLWWTPKNTASFFIQKTLNWLKRNTHFKVVTATVDSSAGEIGVIYQSLNWSISPLLLYKFCTCKFWKCSLKIFFKFSETTELFGYNALYFSKFILCFNKCVSVIEANFCSHIWHTTYEDSSFSNISLLSIKDI